VAGVLAEQQTYRIDHYLGKEAVQNLLALRFGNLIFEPLWNSHSIASVHIRIAESLGIGGRWGYYDNSGALLLINDKCSELYGYDQDDAGSLQQLFVQAFPQQQRRQEVQQRWSQYLDAIQQRRLAVAPQFEFACNGGGVKMVELSGIAIGEMTLVVVHDITDRKQAEYAVEKYRQHLEALVQQRTAELELARDMADSANRAKSVFLANMSHELRTPMHAICSFAELGRLQLEGDAQPARLARYFANIQQSGDRMVALLNGLLDLAKLEAGQMAMQIGLHDLRKVVEHVGEELGPLLQERQLQLQIRYPDFSLQLPIDVFRIEQVVRNVLANAIRYSPPQGRIDIGFSEALLDDGRPAVRISIADQGIGIPEAELESVFEKFVQSSSTATGAGGTGLGLAICRELVLLHRGRISARNRPEGGAVFEVLLPRTAADAMDAMDI